MNSPRISAGRRAIVAAVLPALALAACNRQPAAPAATTDGNSAAPLAALPTTLPMTAEELLESAMLIYLQGLGFPQKS